MKSASPALVAYLNQMRQTPGATLYMANCFTIWLVNGGVATFTDIDIDVSLNGYVYSSNSMLISGLKYKSSIGLNVDEQTIQISAKPTDLINGIPALQAIAQGAFDGAIIQRERVFFPAWGQAPIGSVILFKGRVTSIDTCGRTSAQIKVASDLVLLDIDMPRNNYQANCQHILYDIGCTLSRAAHTTTGAVASGSTATLINWTGATSAYQQGVITFTSGACSGSVATVKSATTGILNLSYPLSAVPAIGDTFSVVQGCDHTKATCNAKFANLANFRGYPFVPPPQIITGPLSSTFTTSGGGK